MFMNNRRMISPMAPVGDPAMLEDLRRRRMQQQAREAIPSAGGPVGQLSPGLPEGAPIQQQTLPTAMRQQQAALEAMRQQQAMAVPPAAGAMSPGGPVPVPAPSMGGGNSFGPPNPMISLTPPSLPVEQGAQEDAARKLMLQRMQQQMLQRGAGPAAAPGGLPGGRGRLMGMWGR